jgi:hypothetical protein
MIALSRKPGKLDTGLIGRGLEGFQNRASVEFQASGVTELDAVLGGGFRVGRWLNYAGLPPPGGRASLSLCWRKPRNDRRPVRSSMCRIL